MAPWLISIIAVFTPVAVLFLIWLFLIAPRARKEAMKPFLCSYAHRGLWGKGVPENSLAAFRAAAEAGFGIELDVQLSKDGEVMVFHDYTLDRVCGMSGNVIDRTAAELCTIPLNGVENECIPTFKQVLEAVGGRVPILIELKGENGNTDLVPKVLELLRDYDGKWCMESFNPLLLRAVRKQSPDTVIGLLSTNLIKEKRNGSKLLNFLLSALWLTFLCRPAFHAWDGRYPKRLALRVGLKWFGAASVVYTIRDPEAYKQYMANGIYPIFEGFVPEK